MCWLCMGRGVLSLESARKAGIVWAWSIGGFVSCPCTKENKEEDK